MPRRMLRAALALAFALHGLECRAAVRVAPMAPGAPAIALTDPVFQAAFREVVQDHFPPATVPGTPHFLGLLERLKAERHPQRKAALATAAAVLQGDRTAIRLLGESGTPLLALTTLVPVYAEAKLREPRLALLERELLASARTALEEPAAAPPPAPLPPAFDEALPAAPASAPLLVEERAAPRELARPPPRSLFGWLRRPAPAPVPSRLAPFQRLAEQGEAELARTVELARGMALPEPERLPYPEDTTFSLELEYLVNRQLSEEDLERSLEDHPLDADEIESWRRDRRLSRPKWAWLRDDRTNAVNAASPDGWDADSSLFGGGNTVELRTRSPGLAYHRNTPADWAGLRRGLADVQARLPGGLYSVHLHLGRQSATHHGDLRVDILAFNRLVKAYEGFWRALAGFGFGPAPKQADIEYLPPKALLDSETGGWHHHAINLSESYPTIEFKLMTGLLGRGGEPGLLDPGSLARRLWWSFSLLDLLLSAPPSLVELGSPLLVGERPTWRQSARFLDVLFRGDLAGKAYALRTLAEALDRPAFVPRDPTEAERKDLASQYALMGIEGALNAHQESGGWDPGLLERLEQVEVQERVGAYWAERGLHFKDETLASFPLRLQEPLRRAYERALRKK